eukprot:CAMPEP_0196790762 /NCGR_PEP_ID=MMETSP1104-20130614/28804_1 /TAXON_ID=33652 /ORGANISM="Cafeteria sp., Strain Caron Lab Isolate" /LENGTH=51 /DNA_ID=CAMNT_0042161129 /DNA_START=185 /DNA_END=340 /DNA_ORIENTATION=-
MPVPAQNCSESRVGALATGLDGREREALALALKRPASPCATRAAHEEASTK